MTQKSKIRAYPKPNIGPKQGHRNYTGAEGYSHVNDMVFSDDIRVWMQAKVRRSKHYKDLF